MIIQLPYHAKKKEIGLPIATEIIESGRQNFRKEEILLTEFLLFDH